jgi:aryl-alcohol dehydrogenase-like predicted oxidoreductase
MRYLDVSTGKRVSKVGLGTHQFGSLEWGYGERYAAREARSIVHRALELGITLFDTAEIYGFHAHRLARRALVEGVALGDVARIPGFGRSEEILGQSLDGRHDAAFLATKLYPSMPAVTVAERRAVASANRLGTSQLDLYQVHQPALLPPCGTVMGGVRALQKAGLIGEVGVSNASLARWRAAEQALGSRVLSNQVGYSLINRGPEHDLLPFAAAHHRLIIAYRPLELGLLGGYYHRGSRPVNLVRATAPLFLPENLERIGELIGVLREVADAHAATPAQVALAWVLRHPAVAAIPGASSVEQLEDNAAAAELDLADDEHRALRDASDRFRPVSGPGFVSRQAHALIGHRSGAPPRRSWRAGARARGLTSAAGPRLLVQVEAVLLQGGQGDGNPSTVPPVNHVLRRLRGVGDAFRGQKLVVVGNVGLESRVSADPDPVAAHEGALAGVHEGGRQAVVGLEVGVGAVIGRRIGKLIVS